MKDKDSSKEDFSEVQNYLNIIPKPGIKEFPLIGKSNFLDVLEDFIGYVNYLNKFLDFNLVYNACKKHKIRKVSFNFSPDAEKIRCLNDKWSSLFLDNDRVDGCKYIIYLNPELDRDGVAKKLSSVFQFEVLPEEVYYPIFFHEIGRIVNKNREENLFQVIDGYLHYNENTYIEQEEIAWEFAKNKFLEWKSEISRYKEFNFDIALNF